jgi:hypothetical protein
MHCFIMLTTDSSCCLAVDGQHDDDTEDDDAEGREEIVCFALHPNGTEIVTASRNLLLR